LETLRRTDEMMTEEMRQEQMQQAARIATDLKARFPALEISGQAYAEPADYIAGGHTKPPRYVAVYVTLVPGTVRMVILLSGAGLNVHGYQLRGMAERKVEADKFREFMQRNHSDIEIPNRTSERPYARVPIWENLRGASDDHDAIARNVLVALAFIAKLPTPRWDQ
jgi:hypothetical protein